MSEYIVCVDDLEESYYRLTDVKPETVFGHRLREEIVRCRDCVHYTRDDTGEFCMLLDFGTVGMAGKFCAWGARRDV